MTVEVSVISTSSLGDRSYLATDGTVAVVIDPQRDIDRVLAEAGRLGARITHVAETHIHNDYVSGGLHLARVVGAEYLVNAADTVDFDRHPVTDGDIIDVSDAMRLRVVATPGHTFHHLSFILDAADGDRLEPHRRLHRRLHALRHHRPPRPARPRTRPHPRPPPARTPCAAWPTCSPTAPKSGPPTASAASAPPPRPTPPPPPSAGKSSRTPRCGSPPTTSSPRPSPASTPTPPTTPTWASPTAPAPPPST